MRFYNKQHRFYCGIDLHARTMYVVILDQAGEVLLLLAPYRDDVVVAVECIFTWYWLADLCAAEGIPFVLPRRGEGPLLTGRGS